MSRIILAATLMLYTAAVYAQSSKTSSKGLPMQPIAPNLWFDTQAEEAAQFYTPLFADSRLGRITRYGKEGFEIHRRPEGSAMTVEFQLAGQPFIALNGGPQFKFNPSISFFVVCETETEVDDLWLKLSDGGFILMPLQKYDWSEKYGWLSDKYGLSWQISLGKLYDVGQKITPALLFVGEQYARAEEALKLYTSIFKDSHVDGILRYEAREASEKEGTVKHAQFGLSGNKFMVMESGFEHPFAFNEAISFMVLCETQEEIDHYWTKLTANGGQESMCGWLKDPFGVSWQIVPTILSRMLQDPDKVKVGRVTNAFLQMKKFDIAKLKQAYEQQ